MFNKLARVTTIDSLLLSQIWILLRRHIPKYMNEYNYNISINRKFMSSRIKALTWEAWVMCTIQYFTHIREVMHYVYGKRQTVDSGVAQKRENLRFSTCLTLLKSYAIYLVNRQEKSLILSCRLS